MGVLGLSLYNVTTNLLKMKAWYALFVYGLVPLGVVFFSFAAGCAIKGIFSLIMGGTSPMDRNSQNYRCAVSAQAVHMQCLPAAAPPARGTCGSLLPPLLHETLPALPLAGASMPARHGPASLASEGSCARPKLRMLPGIPCHATPSLFTVHCSAIKTPVPPGAKLPQIVVQMPVYKESLEEVSSSHE